MSARWITSVFTAGMSRPDSTMLVESRMSYLPSPNSVITRSSSVGARRPWAWTMRASGMISRRRAAMRSRSSRRGTTQNTWPPRKRSRCSASRITTPSNGMMKVRTARRSTGGVAIRLISRTPVSASCRVRGIGVAVRVRTCTSSLIAFSFSLWATPKCCSSSTISRPMWLKVTLFASRAWVPTTMFTSPEASPARTSLASLAPTMRESCATLIGSPAKRAEKVRKCWRDSSVVGTTTATCMPDMAATKAARRATSVLPKPTSPQIRRSIGRPEARSSSTSEIARVWSSVSAKGKRAQNSSQAPSGGIMASASRSLRAAAMRMSSAAMSRTRDFILALRACQEAPPSLSSATPALSLPKRDSISMFSTGRNSLSPPS